MRLSTSNFRYNLRDFIPPAGFDSVGAHGSFTIWPKLALLATTAADGVGLTA
jgi:hypothetical protein